MAVTVPAWGAQTRQSPQRRTSRSQVSSRRGGTSTGRSTRAAREQRMRENAARARVDAVRPRSKVRYIFIAALGFLLAGVVLFLPGLSAQASRGVPESPAQSVVTVRPGDSLWSVAKRTMPEMDTRSAVIELRKANALNSPNLVTGQKLVVPGR